MLPSINYSKEDPKLCLLKEMLNIIDDKKTYRIIGRLDVHNINRFQDMIKILLGSMFFEYTISNLVYEFNCQNDLQTYFNIKYL